MTWQLIRWLALQKCAAVKTSHKASFNFSMTWEMTDKLLPTVWQTELEQHNYEYRKRKKHYTDRIWGIKSQLACRDRIIKTDVVHVTLHTRIQIQGHIHMNAFFLA